MKIAIVHGRNLEGSGIERHANEFKIYGEKHNIEVNIFMYQTDPKPIRYSHVPVDDIIFFNTEVNEKFNVIHIDEAFKFLETHDIVILNSTPSTKEAHKQLAFLKAYENLKHPIKTLNQFDSRPKLADKMPFHLLYENMSDQVNLLSTKTEYAQNVARVFPEKKINSQKHIINVPENIKDNWVDHSDKNNKITFLGRWHVVRDVERLLDFYDTIKQNNSDLLPELYGIERMIACLKTVDHKHAKYHNQPYKSETNKIRENKTNPDGKPGDCSIYPAYQPEHGFEIMENSLFCYSGFNLKKDPQNYRDMFEYAQMEFLMHGSVAAFDKHFCDNNFDENGTAFSEKNIAIYWDKDNPEKALADFEKLKNSKEEYDKVRENALNHIKQEHSAEKFVPLLINDIVTNGKNRTKTNNELLLEIYKTPENVQLFWETAKNNVMELGFKNYDKGNMRIIDGRKIQEVELIKEVQEIDDW